MRGRWAALPLLAVLAVLLATSMWIGPGDIFDPAQRETLWALRGARAGATVTAGAALAVGGVWVQGLFRNPLASPSVLGTTAGATLGGRLALVGTQVFVAGGGTVALVAGGAELELRGELLVPLGCLLGALGALALLSVFQRAGDDLVVLLLSGVLLSSLFISVGGFVTSLAQERWELARAMVAFSLGDVGGVGIRRVLLCAPMVLGGIVAAWSWAPSLDLMLSGEEEAAALGVDLRRLRMACIIWVAALTSAAVAIAGNLGFVGLVVPHALRSWVGASHRPLIVAAALGGAAFLLACDLFTRVVPTQSEIPLGVVTGLVGAPLFLVLLARSRREFVGA